MAYDNNIALRANYSAAIDEVYKLASLTAVLDGDNNLVQQGANANEMKIPKLDMDGLADYSRNTGFVDGSVTLEYETKKCGYDRGRLFMVDARDEDETLVAFSKLASEFVRTKVVPELDAYRIAAYAEVAAGTVGTYEDGAAAIAAISAAKTAIIDAEAEIGETYLFITPSVKGMIDDLDTTASKRAMEDWAGVVTVPSARMYSSVTLTEGGFTGNGSINFLAVPKSAVIQFQKHTVSKIISPDLNQSADAWKFGYRTVGIAETYENKVDAIQVG